MNKLFLQLYTGFATLLLITIMIMVRKFLPAHPVILGFGIVLTIGISSLFCHVSLTPARDFNNWD